MESEGTLHKIIVKKEVLEKDPGDSLLVCQMRDGTYREVSGIFAKNYANIDDGWEVIKARRTSFQDRRLKIFVQEQEDEE